MASKYKPQILNGDLKKMHPSRACKGSACCLHNPSDHHMVDWPLILRESGLMERKCPHGIGHPDPDSLAYFERLDADEGSALGIHGCDGCCRRLMPVEWISSDSRIYSFTLSVNGDFVCFIKQIRGGAWQFKLRGCEWLDLDAKSEEDAEREALDLVIDNFRDMTRAVTAERSKGGLHK